MAQVILSTSFVKVATCPPGKKKVEYFDSATQNLSLEVRASGGKTYYRRVIAKDEEPFNYWLSVGCLRVLAVFVLGMALGSRQLGTSQRLLVRH